MRRTLAILGAAVFAVLASASSASAGHFIHWRGCGCEEKPHPTPEPGPKRHFCHDDERAGFPRCISGHAEPTNVGDFHGYYVGGGGGHGSDSRCREEGTYGWDYTGVHFPRMVILGWNHGRKHQGGLEVYRTEPPVEVPNPFAIPPHGRHHGGETGHGGH